MSVKKTDLSNPLAHKKIQCEAFRMQTNFVKAGSRETISVSSHSLDKTNDIFDAIPNAASGMGPVFGQTRKENVSKKARSDEDKKLDAELEALLNRNEIQIYFES